MRRFKINRRKYPGLGRKMSGAEQRFNLNILNLKGKYEPIKFSISEVEKHIYTPDFLYSLDDILVYIEVKGNYRLQSQDRSRLAFCNAIEKCSYKKPFDDDSEPFHHRVFVWAKEIGTSGRFKCEAHNYICKTMSREIVTREQFDSLINEVLK